MHERSREGKKSQVTDHCIRLSPKTTGNPSRSFSPRRLKIKSKGFLAEDAEFAESFVFEKDPLRPWRALREIKKNVPPAQQNATGATIHVLRGAKQTRKRLQKFLIVSYFGGQSKERPSLTRC